MGHIRVELLLSCSMVGVVVQDAEWHKRRLKNRGTGSRAPSHAIGRLVSSRIQSPRLASLGLDRQLNGIFCGFEGSRAAIGVVSWRVFERRGFYAKEILISSNRGTGWSQGAPHRCSDSEPAHCLSHLSCADRFRCFGMIMLPFSYRLVVCVVWSIPLSRRTLLLTCFRRRVSSS